MDLGHAKRIFITAKKSESVTSSILETYERNLKRFFTEYTISATFFKMIKNEDTSGNGNPVALFSGEQAHLPLMSEYGL